MPSVEKEPASNLPSYHQMCEAWQKYTHLFLALKTGSLSFEEFRRQDEAITRTLFTEAEIFADPQKLQDRLLELDYSGVYEHELGHANDARRICREMGTGVPDIRFVIAHYSRDGKPYAWAWTQLGNFYELVPDPQTFIEFFSRWAESAQDPSDMDKLFNEVSSS